MEFARYSMFLSDTARLHGDNFDHRIFLYRELCLDVIRNPIWLIYASNGRDFALKRITKIFRLQRELLAYGHSSDLVPDLSSFNDLTIPGLGSKTADYIRALKTKI